MKRVMTVQEASEFTGLAVHTLNKLRGKGGGPQFIRLTPRRIGYRPEDLEAYIQARVFNSTDDYPEN